MPSFSGSSRCSARGSSTPGPGNAPLVPHIESIDQWVGQEVVDRDGEKLGKLADVFFRTETDEAVFGAVKHGLLGRKAALVPLAGASLSRDHIRIAHVQAEVDAAPAPADAGALSPHEAAALGSHYGIEVPPGVSYGFESASARDARREAAAAERARAEKLRAEEESRRTDADAARRRAEEAARDAERAEQDASDAQTAAAEADTAAGEAERGPG